MGLCLGVAFFVVPLFFSKNGSTSSKTVWFTFVLQKPFHLNFCCSFLSSILFASGSLAKEETRYIKGLGTVLRAQPSIQSKTLTKLSVVLKCLPWRQKVSGIQLKQKKIMVGFYEVRLEIFHLKSKNRFWVKKYAFPLIHQLHQPSSIRFLKGCAVWVDRHLWC